MPTISTTWAFRKSLRRHAFGWRGSSLAMKRIDEAVSEIRAVARHDPVGAADGAVLFLEKISPALAHVDSSSGALGSAMHAAVEILAPLVESAPAVEATRMKWLERLFEAIQEDDPPYIEALGDRWGSLCASPQLADLWADRLLPTVKRIASDRAKGQYGYFSGTNACFSALLSANRGDEILTLIADDPRPFWANVIWGARVHAARGKPDQAIAYLKERSGDHLPLGVLARFAEQVLIEAGQRQEAYKAHALIANDGGTRIATFRRIAKKYPEIASQTILSDLIASTPGEEGKWFATAKSLGHLDIALELARRSPADPKTLVRAARDYAAREPAFAMEIALLALRGMAYGGGYEISGVDVLQAFRYGREAATNAGHADEFAHALRQLVSSAAPSAQWLRGVLQI